MNILFYLTRFPGWGGIETVTELIGAELCRNGHDITLLAHSKQSRQSVLNSQSHYYLMPDENEFYTDNNLHFALKVIKKHQINVVIYQDSYSDSDGILKQIKYHYPFVKIVVFEHNTPDYIQKILNQSYKASVFHEIYRRIYSWPRQNRKSRNRHLSLLKVSDRYIVLARGYIQVLSSLCHLTKSSELKNKIDFINNPVKTVCFEEWEKNNSILFVGQINSQKRVDLMLKMWEYIVMTNPGWTFRIVGDGPLRDEMIKMVSDRKIANVFFEGYQQPEKFYCDAKLFWMTSDFEGWPLTLTEAMSYGCVPIVFNTFAACEDIIDNGKNGYLIEGSDSKEFVKKTVQLIKNNEMWSRMSFDARKLNNALGVDVIIKKWLHLLDSLNVK